MYSAVEIARYLISLDHEKGLFDKELVERNGRKFYRGNARLNKYLHMAQNLYIAKTGEKLFADDLYAYDNGAVVPYVQENYALLLAKPKDVQLPDSVCDFLRRVYVAFKNAELDELIELSHEDEEWIQKHRFYSRPEQCMDSLAHVEEYREQYRDMLKVMERMAFVY